MPITKKIMLLYASLFTVTIVTISCILLITAKDMGIAITFSSLQTCSESIESYIRSGKEINAKKIQDVIGSSYVDYIIENHTDGKILVSGAFLDDGSGNSAMEPMNRNELPDDITGSFNFREKSAKSSRIRVFGSDGYTLYTKNGHEFIGIQKEFVCDGCIYTVNLYRALLSNAYYIKFIASRLIYVDILGILAAGIIGVYISYVLLRPVRKIRETAERISGEDLSQRIEITGPDDELKELSVTFNSMIERLEQSFEQQSRFVSDASHELRTPIAVIKGYANLIDRWGKDDPEILQESVNNILEETEHMSVMIKNLLFLARSDQKRNHVQKQPMSLNEAINDIAKDLGVTDEKVRVVTDICEEDIVINGDPDLIKQMLWIFTENAVKYSGENKEITYRLYKEDGYACACVKDNGFGISEEDLPHIFDRFYRVDKSRNKEIPGNGLGLSIAKWIIDVHNAEVEVNSAVGQGTEFITKFKLE